MCPECLGRRMTSCTVTTPVLLLWQDVHIFCDCCPAGRCLLLIFQLSLLPAVTRGEFAGIAQGWESIGQVRFGRGRCDQLLPLDWDWKAQLPFQPWTSGGHGGWWNERGLGFLVYYGRKAWLHGRPRAPGAEGGGWRPCPVTTAVLLSARSLVCLFFWRDVLIFCNCCPAGGCLLLILWLSVLPAVTSGEYAGIARGRESTGQVRLGCGRCDQLFPLEWDRKARLPFQPWTDVYYWQSSW